MTEADERDLIKFYQKEFKLKTNKTLVCIVKNPEATKKKDTAEYKHLYINNVIEFASEYFDVPVHEIKAQSRKREVIRWRQMIAKEFREKGCSYNNIATRLGGFHHATIINSMTQFKMAMKTDENYKDTYLKFKSYCENKMKEIQNK